MQQIQKTVCAMLALIGSMQADAVSFYTARSQSVNAAREMVGWEEQINKSNQDDRYGSFSITPEYTRSFYPNKIAQCLFGPDLQSNDDCGSSLLIQGSLVPSRNAKAWLADYFGLPMDFNGTVSFNPRISNFLVDFNFYLGLDDLVSGMYLRIHAPLVHTRWNLNVCESSTKGTLDYPYGYFAPEQVQNGDLLGKALDFFYGGHVPQNMYSSGFPGAHVPPIINFQPLACSRWACDCSSILTKTRLSDVECVAGWNFWSNQDYLIGLGLRVSAPAGNKPSSCYLFEPMVGSGGFWKLGGSLNFHGIFWRDEEKASSFGLYLDANIQHLFKTCQKRCFDLCSSGTCFSKKNSRYMLAQRLELLDSTNFLSGEPLTGFANEFAPVANLTTFNVDVNISVEADIAAKFAYTHGNYSVDLGYNFYGRSCEKLCIAQNCLSNPLDGQTWALKGDAQVFGFLDGSDGASVALAATESCATIHAGTNQFTSTTSRLNTSIDSPQQLYFTNPFIHAITGSPTASFTDPAFSTYSSNPPVYLSRSNLDLSGTRAITHKLFVHAHYTWNDNGTCTPYAGIGGEVEFAGSGSCGATSCCTSSCVKCAPSQWGIWLKGGVSF